MSGGRRYELDWLRVLATFAVVFFHCVRFFDVDPWEVKNNVTTELVMPIIALFAEWMMPLFFVISGAAIYFSLGFRKPSQFIKSRITRILIPFLIMGVLILVPPQLYIRDVKEKQVTTLSDVTVRFAGDSGDGMQLTGTQFSDTTAWVGNDLSTLPDYPAEIEHLPAHYMESVDFNCTLVVMMYIHLVIFLMCWLQ